MRTRILILSIAVFFGPIPAYAGLFDEVKEENERKEHIGRSLKQNKSMVKSLEVMMLMLTYSQMEKGDCTPALKIEGKAKSGDAESQWLLADLYRNGLCFNK